MADGYVYSVWIRRRGEIVEFNESLLPHIVAPDRAIQNMRAEVVDRLGLCVDCQVAFKCHVIIWVHKYGREVGEKYCPVLFNDAVKPKWKVEELV